MAYAKNTSVSTDRSEVQIKGILRKHGADGIMIGENRDMVAIQFSMSNRQIRFIIPTPSPEDDDIKFTDSGKVRADGARQSALDQAMRQRYRLLFLVVKAKLEAVESKVVTFDDEFLAHTVMPNGQTFGEIAKPQIETVYNTGKMPPLLGYQEEAQQ